MAVTLVLKTHVVSVADSLTSQQCQNLVVPAYFYPGVEWTRIGHGGPAPRIMIIDPAGPGAGRSPERNYQASIQQARAAGATIMGYSDTSYSRRPSSAVEADVRNYKAWYGVTSIFLDQVSSGGAELAYYAKLARYIHDTNPGSAVMLNPGTYPDQRYMSIGDIVMVFENSYATYAGIQVPGWVSKYPAARFAHIVYATSAAQLTDALALAASRRAGYVYVTDGTGSQRYASLPSYWQREDNSIAQCAAGATGAIGRTGVSQSGTS